MLTKKTPKPALEMRKDLHPSRPLLEDLARKMGKFWDDSDPSDCPLVPGLVYQSGFMHIESPSRTLAEKLKGERLIDLGAGNSESFTAMAHLAATLGVKEYIAVDKYVDYSRAEALLDAYVGEGYPEMILRAVNDEILLFLSKMRDESAHIVMNSIDRCMLVCMEHFLDEMYGLELASEIARVVPRGGIAFGVNSPNLERLLRFGFTGRFENPGYIFTKGE
jgi:hypothetical protein